MTAGSDRNKKNFNLIRLGKVFRNNSETLALCVFHKEKLFLPQWLSFFLGMF